MYKLVGVAMMFFYVIVANAQSKLKVSLTNNSQITIEVDGKHFSKNGTSITVSDLPTGRHTLRIFEFSKNRYGRIFEDLIFEGKANTYYGNITIFEYDIESGNINVYDENIDSFYTNPSIKIESDKINNDNVAQQQSSNKAASIPNISTLNDTKISSLKAKVDDKNADTYKLKAVKEGLLGEKISTNQVGTIMEWFGFESTKEEFAEWAYDITVDKENYGTLETKFSYKNYQDDFENFLKKQ